MVHHKDHIACAEIFEWVLVNEIVRDLSRTHPLFDKDRVVAATTHDISVKYQFRCRYTEVTGNDCIIDLCRLSGRLNTPDFIMGYGNSTRSGQIGNMNTIGCNC